MIIETPKSTRDYLGTLEGWGAMNDDFFNDDLDGEDAVLIGAFLGMVEEEAEEEREGNVGD